MDSHFGFVNLFFAFFVLSVLLYSDLGVTYPSTILKAADAILKQFVLVTLEVIKLYAKSLDPTCGLQSLPTLRLAPIRIASSIIHPTGNCGIPEASTGPFYPNTIFTPDVAQDSETEVAEHDVAAEAISTAPTDSKGDDLLRSRSVEIQPAEDKSPVLPAVPYTNNVSLPSSFVPHPTWDYDEDYLHDIKDVEDRHLAKLGVFRGQVCSWALLDKPDVFYKNSGPTLVLTSPDGDVKYPQDMATYPGESNWADDDDEEW